MKKEIIIDEHAALQAGLQAMRRYNRAMYISIKDIDEVVDQETIKQFFEADPFSEKESKAKKILVKAASMATYNHPDIPHKYKQNCAVRCAKEFNEVLMGAKGDYLREVGYFGVSQLQQLKKYNEYQENNMVVQTATTLDGIKQQLKKLPQKLIKKHGIKGLTGLISGGIAHLGIASGAAAAGSGAAVVIGGITLAPAIVPVLVGITSIIVMDIVTELIPRKIKRKIKEKSIEYIEKTSNYVERQVERFSQTKVGTVAKKVVDYVAPVVKCGYDFVKEKAENAKNWIKSKLTSLKARWA